MQSLYLQLSPPVLAYTLVALAGGALLGLFGLVKVFGFRTEHAGGHILNLVHEVLANVGLFLAGAVLFGLFGVLGTLRGLPDLLTFLIALAFGTSPFVLAQLLRGLDADGYLRKHAVNKTGTVLEPVPAGKAGRGKVRLRVYNRDVDFAAETAADELPAGILVRVVAVLNADAVEVTREIDFDRVWDAVVGRGPAAPAEEAPA
jgi:hypothetical protein